MENNLYELTNPQKSIWLTEQYYKNTSVNNISGTVLIKKKINFDVLKKSIYEYVKTNDSFLLKLCIDYNGNIKQYLGDFDFFNIDFVSLSSTNELSDLEKQECEKIFSIFNSNLFHFTMFSFPDSTGGFILTVHHIISDAQTVSQVASKVMNFYTSFLYGKNPEILQTSYIDYINSEKEYLLSEKYLKDKEYWEKLFEESTVPASLSIKSTDNNILCNSSRETFLINKQKMEKINNYCKSLKVSCFHFFMAIFSLYIGKVTNEKNFVIGTPILNRTTFKEKNTAGMFISTVPFLINLEKNMPFSSFLTQIGTQTMSMFRHQKYPFQDILQYVRKQDPSLPNLYNIMLSYQINKSDGNNCIVPYTTKWTHSNTNMDELDIHLFDVNDTGELSIAYDYQLAKYAKEDIVLLHKRILSIIEQVLENENILTNQIELVLSDEKNFMLNIYNKPINESISKTVIELFEEQVKKVPNQLAVCFGSQCLTYKELNNAASYLVNYLCENGINSTDKVCLFFPNSIELIISILAVLKLGACYIPIDVTYPIDRIKYITQNSECKMILTNQIDKLGELSAISTEINLDTILESCENTIYTNSFKPSLQDLAYIIYTSGSTGNPKGVKIAHESLSNYIRWANEQYVKGEVTNFPLYSSISFDLTVTSIFTPLVSGNGIYIYQNSNPQLLLKQIIDDKKVQIIKLTPAHLILLQDCIDNSSVITKFIVGGDILTNELCSNISNIFSHPIHIFNEYGPTEATVGCMIYEYVKNEYATVPIGIPAANTNLFVLNDDLNLIPFGYNGQLYIAGKGLSKGYVSLPSMTASKFVYCPFLENKIMYQSGDIVKLYNTGVMECIGRSDFQVKINGFRIEIGEIQSKILNYPGIKDCFISVLEMQGVKVLCAYYACNNSIDLKSLKNHLQKTLPTYMVPKYFVALDKLPLTANGKVNKSLLPAPTITENTTIIKPENEMEKVLHNIFCELLNINEISVTTNFFDYYIDSLTIIKAQTKLYSMGYNVNAQDFYEYPTIRKLTSHLLHKDIEVFDENDTIPIISDIVRPCVANCTFNNILLFGSTGFLGIHILHDLLKSTNSKIYCIVREKNGIAAKQRLQDKFGFYFENEDIKNFEERITLVPGNILKDKLGLVDEKYEFLGNTIDCVIDTAALVKHYGEYEKFDNTNVKGTKKIVDLCTKYNIPLHYISTLSVSGYGLVKSPKAVFTEKDFYIGQNYKDNVYVRSKFEAEKIILNACKYNNLCATIYRVGNITNRFSDGMFQENARENAFLNRISSLINMQCMPKELLDATIEFTPVDYCSNFIVSLLKQKATTDNLTIYHLFNENYLTFRDIFNLLLELNMSMEICNLQDFEKQVLNGKDNFFGIINYISNIKETDFNLVSLDNTYTNNILRGLSLSWPNITKEYLQTLIKYLEKNKFIGSKK